MSEPKHVATQSLARSQAHSSPSAILTYQSWLGSSRASLPKVKTGCVTCKKRHIKCPGEKPSCSKCNKGGRLCHYLTAQPQQKKATQIHFKFHHCNPETIQYHRRFDSDAQRYGLKVFEHQSIEVLGPALGWSDWGVFVLQNTEHDSTLQYAVAALGAIYAYEVGVRKHDRRADILEFSYSQYDNAIQLFRTRIQSGQEVTSERSMLTCILFGLFDFVLGNEVAAAIHLKAGIVMLSKLLIGTSVATRTSDGPTANSVSHHSTLLGKFVKAFSFLDFWSVKWSNSRPVCAWLPCFDPSSLTIEPPINTSDELQFRMQSLATLESRIQEFLRLKKSECFRSKDIFSKTRQDLLDQLMQWHYRVTYLCTEPCGNLEYDEEIDIQILMLNHKKLETMLLACHDEGVIDYRSFDSAFETIIRNTAPVIMHDFVPDSHFQVFSFQPGVIHPLYITAICCCNINICEQAIDLLQKVPWREGAWDGKTMSNIARRRLSERLGS